jgi:hypothetical protein
MAPRLGHRIPRKQCVTLVLLSFQEPAEMSLLSQRRRQQRPVWLPAAMSRRPKRRQSIKQKRKPSNRVSMAEL